MKQVEEKNSDDIVMTVPFNKRTLTWKTNSTGQVKPLFNIDKNVHQIQFKEILCNYLYQVAGYSVKKTWLQAIKDRFSTSWLGLTYALVSKFLLETSEETATGDIYRQRPGIKSTRVPVVERNTLEKMEIELPGQGKLHHNRQQ